MSAPDPRAARVQARAVRERAPYPVLRGVGAVVSVLLLGAGVLGTAPSLMTQERSDSTPLPEDLTRLVLEAPRGDVEVRELRAGEAPRVDTTTTWTLNRPELVVREDDGTVRLDAPCTGGNLGVCSQDVAVWVPPGTTLDIDGTFGDIDVSTTGDVQVELTGGDVSLSGSPQRAEVRSTLGDVTIDHTGTEPPELLRVRTTLGDVEVLVPDAPGYAVTASSRQGDRQVRVDRDADSPFVVDVETTLGDIDVAPSPAP